MWDLPRPGLEPVSPALAGRFSTTVPPGKPPHLLYSSVDGDLRCFHLLAIINNAAVNTEVHESFQIKVFLFSSEENPEVELLDPLVVLFLIFGETPYYFP